MHITDPDNPGTTPPTSDPTNAAANADTQAAPPQPSNLDDDADMLAAIDAKLAEDAPPPPDEGEPVGGQPPGTTNAEDAPPAEGQPPAAGDPKPGDKPADAKDALSAEDEAIVKGLKDKAGARFRELIDQVKADTPMREALAAAGIKEAGDIPKLAQQAKDGSDFIEMVTSTGASAEQYGMTLDYLSLVTKAASGDAQAAQKAWDIFMEEGKALAAALGRELPGVFDPLTGHDDLAAAVQGGDMTRQAALEVAGARRSQASIAEHQRAQQAQAQQQAQQQQAIQSGVQALAAWEADKLTDPAYMQLRQVLSEKVAEIRKQFPPAQWVEATKLAYDAIKAQRGAQPQQPAAPASNPIRASGPRPAMVPEFDSMEDAVEFGLKQYAAGGR